MVRRISWRFVVVVRFLAVVARFVAVALSVVVVVCRFVAAFALVIGCRVLCAKPFRRGVEEFGCGQCKPCRLNRKRLWTSRLMLEGQLHESSFFVTLTYDKEHLPCDGSVSLRDAQLFLKRLRFKMAMQVPPQSLRYFIVGEYGDVSMRPHYHAVLFGLRSPELVKESWSQGMIHVGSLTEQSAGYVVSYTVKGLTSVRDARLKGRAAEFARMSLKPGIGAGAVAVIREALVDRDGVIRHVDGDVPGCVRKSGVRWPLGRYLRGKLRERIGGVSEVGQAARARELQARLQEKGAWKAREGKRVQDSRRAAALIKISQSKKGLA